MKLVNGATYRFVNRATENIKQDKAERSLNVFGLSPSNLANVCLFGSDPGDICQQWVYKESGGHKYLVCKGNSSLVLDLYTGFSATANVTNYNAHVFNQVSDTCYLEIEPASDDASEYIQIKLANYTNKYLTANQGNNGSGAGKDVNAAGNVYFYKGGLTDFSQDWRPIRQDGTMPDPEPEPGKEVVVTNMPSCWAYTGNKEYFHPASGMISGDFKTKNNGEDILTRIKRFYETVFKTTLTGAADSRENMDKYGYSLFGSRTVTNDHFNGTYHLGVDMTKAYGAKIYSAHSGELLRADSYYIAIYDKDKNAVYLYLHANVSSDIKNKGRYYGVPVQIKKNQLLGTQSDVGLGNKNYHLHFEVRKYRENDYVPQMPTNSLGNSVFEKYLCPYDYM